MAIMLNNETQVIKNLIKALLKENRFTQSDLAEYLGLSLPSIKRSLGKEDISLDRLSKIAAFFNLNVSDLFEMAKNKSLDYLMITDEQEKLFVKDLIYLKVFRALVLGLNKSEVRSRYDITNTKYIKILSDLEKAELLEVWPNDRVRILVKWPFQFSANGEFKSKLLPRLRKETLKKANMNSNTIITELALSKDHHGSLNKEIKETVEKYRKVSASDMKNYNYKKLTELTVVYSSISECLWDSLD